MNFVVLMVFIYSILSSLGLGGLDLTFLIVLVIIGLIIIILIKIFLVLIPAILGSTRCIFPHGRFVLDGSSFPRSGSVVDTG